jgi:hypothetical protein
METSDTDKNIENGLNFEYRKIQTILGDVSFSLVLPKQYAVGLGLRKGEFVKVKQDKNKIIIEKA